MPKLIKIDGSSYDYETLSPEARKQLLNLRITDAEIERLRTQINIARTARAAYAQELKSQLAKSKT